LPLCAAVRGPDGDEPLTAALRAQLEATSDALAARALRVLAVGVVEGGDLDGRLGFAGLAGRVTLLGLFGQIDPPRPEVAEAVVRCRRAGIRPVMVTGDHKATGAAIARELGIAGPDDRVVDGRELEAMSDAELAADLDRIAVFARVHPAQKLRIVGAYQARGEVVAMTGDGVNDAPALVAADVGVAMGQTGTEVAKEASKIVVGDDNFATIVAAVEEGRVVYRNIKKAVLLLVSTSAAEVLVLLLALIAGYPPPFAAGADPVEQPGHRGPGHRQLDHGAGRGRRDDPPADRQR
jgi:Ca2+-transporting ATPase